MNSVNLLGHGFFSVLSKRKHFPSLLALLQGLLLIHCLEQDCNESDLLSGKRDSSKRKALFSVSKTACSGF